MSNYPDGVTAQDFIAPEEVFCSNCGELVEELDKYDQCKECTLEDRENDYFEDKRDEQSLEKIINKNYFNRYNI